MRMSRPSSVSSRSRAVGFAAVATMVGVTACSDQVPTAPAPPAVSLTSVSADVNGSVIAWNEIARRLVSEHRTDPPMASRVYALLSVAQLDAVTLASRGESRAAQHADASRVAASISAASSIVLARFYPD